MPDHDPQHSAHLVLLAYQSGLIDRAAFDAILDACHADRSQPVAALQADLGKVSDESLARRHAQDVGGTAHAGSSTVEELATRVPEFTETFLPRTPSLSATGTAPSRSVVFATLASRAGPKRVADDWKWTLGSKLPQGESVGKRTHSRFTFEGGRGGGGSGGGIWSASAC